MDVSIAKQLGKGTSATVYLVHVCNKRRKGIRKFALKVLTLGGYDEEKKITQEVEILRSLKHDHIVNFFDSFEDGDNMMICMEYCSRGTLGEYLQSRKPQRFLTETTILKLAVQIASAVQYLHKNKIIQRDLKPANIFLTDTKTVKVGDFGISRSLENTMALANTFIGSPLYMASEILCFNQYGYKVDVWSFGCCLYEMMTLEYAFPNKPGVNILTNIRDGKYSPLPPRYSENLQNLVKETIVTDIDQRLSSSDVYSFLVGMFDIEQHIPVHSVDKVDIPNKDKIIKAYRKYFTNEYQLPEEASSDNHDVDYSSDKMEDDEDREDAAMDRTLVRPLTPGDQDIFYNHDDDDTDIESPSGTSTRATITDTTLVKPLTPDGQNGLFSYENTDTNIESRFSASTGGPIMDTTLVEPLTHDGLGRLYGRKGTETTPESRYGTSTRDSVTHKDVDGLYGNEDNNTDIRSTAGTSAYEYNSTQRNTFSSADKRLQEQPKNKAKGKKKKTFLRAKANEIKENRVPQEPVTLFTRSQKVHFNKLMEAEGSSEEEDDIYSDGIRDKCKKDIGEDLYKYAMRLGSAIRDKKSLKSRLKEMLGTENYEQYNRIFLDQ